MSREIARRLTSVIRPHLITHYMPTLLTGKRVQKKVIRRMLGWVRPIICPTCRQYTKQHLVPGKLGAVVRQRTCASCGTVFSRKESRLAGPHRRRKGSPNWRAA